MGFGLRASARRTQALRYMAVPKIRRTIWGPYKQDQRILGSTLGQRWPLFSKLNKHHAHQLDVPFPPQTAQRHEHWLDGPFPLRPKQVSIMSISSMAPFRCAPNSSASCASARWPFPEGPKRASIMSISSIAPIRWAPNGPAS